MKSRKVSPAGLIILGPHLQAVACNAEAIRILAYPDSPNRKSIERMVSEKLPFITTAGGSGALASRLTQIVCGRRRYVCRQYVADPLESTQPPIVVVLLERVSSAEFALQLFSQQFHLTARENEALSYLLQGLTSKEIASRMDISPNTLKTFFRLVMVKVGVSSRASLIGTIAAMRSGCASFSVENSPLTTSRLL